MSAADFARVDRSFRSWALTTDHKRIGILFFFAVSLFLLLGGTFAMIIRIEHLTPGPAVVTEMTSAWSPREREQFYAGTAAAVYGI